MGNSKQFFMVLSSINTSNLGMLPDTSIKTTQQYHTTVILDSTFPLSKYENSWYPYLYNKKKKHSDQTNKQERDRNPPCKQDHVLLFTVNKENWPIRREYLSHVTIIMQNGHLPAKITSLPKYPPILQASFLYSVTIYKYNIWNNYSSRFWHYFRPGNHRMINIYRLSWPTFCRKSVQNRAYNREQCSLATAGEVPVWVF